MAKQNKTKLYAKALAEVLMKPSYAKASEGRNKVADNFIRILVGAGLEKKAKEILELAEDLVLAKQGKSKITFETARKMTASQKKMAGGIVKEGDIVKEKINPELIAGIKIIINNSKQFDASMKSKLQEIF
ncbi:MAG: F0F1 ATP synthase subunit delta [Candidatus Staskawiczbacteria bacterium]|nr:F0F1 ATP synthase subunit delta [Candidatus Staskawiczbacteria bacterium]